MTCEPLIRADAGSTLPHPTRVPLAVAARGGDGKAVAGRTAGTTPPRTLRSVGTAACLRVSGRSSAMPDMLDRSDAFRPAGETLALARCA